MRSALILSLAGVASATSARLFVRQSTDAVTAIEAQISAECSATCSEHLKFVRECFWTASEKQPETCRPVCDDEVWTRYQNCTNCAVGAGLDQKVLDLGGVCKDGEFKQNGMAWIYKPSAPLPVPSASETIVPTGLLGDVKPEPGVVHLITAPATADMGVVDQAPTDLLKPTPAPSPAKSPKEPEKSSASRQSGATSKALIVAFASAALGAVAFLT